MGAAGTKAGAPVRIRRARPTDAPAVALLTSALGYPCGAEAMSARLEALGRRRQTRVAVALEGGRIVGVVAACLERGIDADSPRGRVTALCVSEADRGRGIGALLLSHAEAWLERQGASCAVIHSGLRRRMAHRFYRREGYRVTGLRLYKELGAARAAVPGERAA